MTPPESWSGTIGRRLVTFVSAPSTPHPLAVFRIGVALVLLVKVWTLSGSILEFFGSQGLVQWTVAKTNVSPLLPHLSSLAHALRGLGVSENECVQGVFYLYALALIGLLLGWRTRLSAFAAWLTHTILLNSGSMSAYGVESFAHFSLFYCMVMPVGDAYSLDQHAGRTSDAPSATATLSLRVLQLHLCVVYLSSGVEKAMGEQWRNGEAIWRSVMMPDYAQFDFTWLALTPWLATLAAWGTLAVEIGYAFLIWPRRTRQAWVLATLGLHLGIGLFMGLWLFSCMMGVLTFSAFGWNLLVQSRMDWLRGMIGGKPSAPA